uniref:Uncharacterized protein AlNc14C1G28 n=1 Tax=Albugo laibachii Nc14 TaxID=890382 RepID=F0VYM5_9STRA|nr:conserved hypothetical protein [Albugo laibachii Nc14]|eukprot:CCA13889.1 conserved hypothetical protein [Albugo laibachii Nc14]
MSSSGASPNIPSLKHTLSGNASNAPAVHLPHTHSRNQSHQSSNHNRPNSMAGLSQHSLVHGHGNPNSMHNESNTAPPQMLRAVTATGVYNRPMNIHNNGPGSNPNNSMVSGARLPGSSATNFPASSTTLPTSAVRSASGSSPNMQNWRMYLTIEERQAVRSKIRDAYLNKCTSYDDILQVACAIEEELLHISAPSRLDYFKSGFEFETRVKLKREQFKGIQAAEAKHWGNTGNESVSNIGNGCSPKNYAGEASNARSSNSNNEREQADSGRAEVNQNSSVHTDSVSYIKKQRFT